MDSETRVARARKRVEEIKGFYVHLSVYLIVNAGIFAIDAITGGHWWFYWPLFGWGIALAIHAAALFFGGPYGSRWEERKLRHVLGRDEAA